MNPRLIGSTRQPWTIVINRAPVLLPYSSNPIQKEDRDMIGSQATVVVHYKGRYD